MLPSLDVFKKIPCPDLPNCQRPKCIFSHEQQQSVPSKRTRPQQTDSPAKTVKTSNPSVNKSNSSSKNIPHNSNLLNKGASSSQQNNSSKSTRIAEINKASYTINKDPTHRVAHVATFTGPPTIKADISSHTALKIRQTISNKLYEQYSRLYPDKHVAARQTQEQEQTILSSTLNTAGYKQQAMSTLMQLKKQQPKAEEPESTITTTPKENINQSSSLDPAYLNTLILTDAQMDAMQYPPRSLLESSKRIEKQQQQQQQTCDRCNKPFTVKAILDAKDIKACQYHHGRLRVSSSFGEKQRTYTCCGDTLGSLGCEKGPHVFKDEQVEKLHATIPFIKVPSSSSSTTTSPEKILALDCEMGYTTIGMELIRLTVINANHEKVLDELVLPSHMVIDLNTRYSGITTLAGVKHNLVSIRQALFDLMDPTTILLGHGLENDLKALRIVHDKIIDTAALFPHPHGLPYRYGLRVLATKYLSKFIQSGSDGHDSYEDAGTCLELLHTYIKTHPTL